MLACYMLLYSTITCNVVVCRSHGTVREGATQHTSQLPAATQVWAWSSGT